jgi:hypothetical protein
MNAFDALYRGLPIHNHPKHFPRILFLIYLGLLFAFGVAIIIGNSPGGIGIYHDSIFYLTSATNLTNGDGLSWFDEGNALKPLTHFPPLYPLTLSVFITLGVSAETAAQWISAFFFGGNVVIMGFLAASFSQRLWIGIITSILMLLSPVLLGIHLVSYSEPLFIFFSLTFIWTLSRHIIKPTKSTFILLTALAALGYLSRYVGVVLLVTGFSSILLFGEEKARTRIRNAFLFFLLAFIPMSCWLLRNFIRTGSATNRSFQFHPPQRLILDKAINTIAAWFLPVNFPPSIKFIFVFGLALILGFMLFILKKGEFQLLNKKTSILVLTLTTFIALYLFAIMFSITFFDASTPIDHRIFSPIYVATLLVSVLLSAALWVRIKNQLPTIILLFLVGFLSWKQWTESSILLRESRNEGLGFSNRTWKESKAIEWVSELPVHATIYTNERLGLTYLTGKPAFSIPEKIDPVRSEIRIDFEQNFQRMQLLLRDPDSYLVLFDPYNLRWEMPTREEITFPLSGLENFEDAIVYINPSNLK